MSLISIMKFILFSIIVLITISLVSAVNFPIDTPKMVVGFEDGDLPQVNIQIPEVIFNNDTLSVNHSIFADTALIALQWNTNLGNLDDVESTQFSNVGGTLTIQEIYCRLTGGSGCTMSGDIDVNNNNITNVKEIRARKYLFIDEHNTSYIKFSDPEDWAGSKHAMVFGNNDPDTIDGAITNLFYTQENKTQLFMQFGLNNSYGGLGNSIGIIPNYWGIENFSTGGIVNLTNLSNYITICDTFSGDFFTPGDTCRFFADTRGRGMPLFFTGDLEVWRQFVTHQGIDSIGPATFTLNGGDLNIQNGSIHIFTPVTFLKGVTILDEVTTFQEFFMGNLGSFTNLQDDDGNWFANSDVLCDDGDCANTIGISGVGNIIMEANISTTNINTTSLNFIYSLTNMLGANDFTVTANNNVGSGEVTLLTDSTNDVVKSSQSILMPSSMSNQPSLSIRFNCDVTQTNRQCFVDTIVVNGTAIATTLTNVSGFDSVIKMSDGALAADGFPERGIIYNASGDVIIFRGNATFQNVVEQDLNITNSITLNSTTIFDWAGVLTSPNFPSHLLANGSTPLTLQWNVGNFAINLTNLSTTFIGSPSGLINYGNNNFNGSGNFTTTGNITANTGFFDKVGIGTSSPDSVFHIKANTAGSVGSHSAGQIIIQNPADTVFANAVITGYESDADGNPDQQLWYLGSLSSSNSNIILLNRRNAPLQLGTNGNTQMTILGNGDIGIGTTSPTHKLNVVGDVNFTGNLTVGNISLKFGDLVSEQNPDAVDAIRIKSTGSDVDVVIGDGTGYFMVWNALDNNPVFFVNNVGNTDVIRDLTVGRNILLGDGDLTTTGRIGIGTTSLTHALNILGDVNISGDAIFQETGSIRKTNISGSIIRGTPALRLRAESFIVFGSPDVGVPNGILTFLGSAAFYDLSQMQQTDGLNVQPSAFALGQGGNGTGIDAGNGGSFTLSAGDGGFGFGIGGNGGNGGSLVFNAGDGETATVDFQGDGGSISINAGNGLRQGNITLEISGVSSVEGFIKLLANVLHEGSYTQTGEQTITGSDGLTTGSGNAPTVSTINGGNGDPASGMGSFAGAGSSTIQKAGAGGLGAGIDQIGGSGGGIFRTAGNGGNVTNNFGFSGGVGGPIKLISGAGGSGLGSSTGLGADGGDIELTTGEGGISVNQAGGSFGNIIMVKDGGNVFIGDSSNNTNATVLTVYGNITASNFVDLTEGDLRSDKEALDSIISYQSYTDLSTGKVKINDSGLSDFVKAKVPIYENVYQRTIEWEETIWDNKTKSWINITLEEDIYKREIVGYQDGRSLSNSITEIWKGIKALFTRNEEQDQMFADICTEENAKYSKYDWCDVAPQL